MSIRSTEMRGAAEEGETRLSGVVFEGVGCSDAGGGECSVDGPRATVVRVYRRLAP